MIFNPLKMPFIVIAIAEAFPTENEACSVTASKIRTLTKMLAHIKPSTR